ncbi:MAG: hypothetical protein MJZ57_06820, partial [Bacteroidales bacterium]|nr:hypothetical protein [Bacteroidales bacterium]
TVDGVTYPRVRISPSPQNKKQRIKRCFFRMRTFAGSAEFFNLALSAYEKMALRSRDLLPICCS